MTTGITLFEPKNVGTIAQIAPQAYNENSISHDRCLQVGQHLLERASSEGMSDALDQEIATFIERAKKTLKKMNGKRAAVTQLFDSIRSAYTGLENEVDPSRKGTIPALLQEHRNQYAAKKREEYEAEMRRKQLEQAKAAARARYATDVENDYVRQFNALLVASCNRLTELDRSLTIDNYEQVADAVGSTSDQLPTYWYRDLKPAVPMPQALAVDEARNIAMEVRSRLWERFTKRYADEVASMRDDIADRLPSKLKQLQRIAQADKEEAERIRKQVEQRERMEAEQRERERLEREAKEKAAAELAAQKQEMDGLFGAAEIQAAQYQPKTSVRKRINVLNPEGFMQVVGMWWAQYGCTLTVAELEKEFKKQITFCNKLANDKEHPVFIQSAHIEYIDDVKAK